VTAAAAALAERAAPPGDEAAALLLLCGGVGVAISEGAGGGGARGVSLAAASVLAGAAQLTLQGRALAGRLDALSLALLTAPVTAACLAAPAWATERAAAAAFFAADGARAAGVLGAGAAAALAYNVVHNELVGLAGPVAACVLGQVKIVALMALSAAVLGEGRDFSPRMSAGCAAAIAGFGLYTWARVRRQAAPAGAARRGAALRRGSSAGAAKSPRTPASRAVQLRLEIPAPAGDLPGLMTPGSSAARRTPSARRARTPAGAV
jgi:drug/metabolite transporter (DMT)-like permease